MIRCTKCENETRSSQLITAQGEVLLAGTLSSDPQPILAQVCSACGYIELYAPQPTARPEVARDSEERLLGEVSSASVPQPAA
jgi:predicted nucleic-acid-binding Zn-ribbon protein